MTRGNFVHVVKSKYSHKLKFTIKYYINNKIIMHNTHVTKISETHLAMTTNAEINTVR